MRWIISLFVILVLSASATLNAAHTAASPLGVAAEAASGPVMESACEGCPDITPDCLTPTCKMQGVFGGGVHARSAGPMRIGRRMAGDTRASGLVSPPTPPPPRG